MSPDHPPVRQADSVYFLDPLPEPSSVKPWMRRVLLDIHVARSWFAWTLPMSPVGRHPRTMQSFLAWVNALEKMRAALDEASPRANHDGGA